VQQNSCCAKDDFIWRIVIRSKRVVEVAEAEKAEVL
jgi:hypothetical protein